MAAKKREPAKEPASKTEVGSRSNGLVFAVAALDMSWRLAVVVLVPIIGGYELDTHAGTGPIFMILGFLVAIAGLFVTLKWVVKIADQKFTPRSSGK